MTNQGPNTPNCMTSAFCRGRTRGHVACAILLLIGTLAVSGADGTSSDELVKRGLEAESRMDPKAALELFERANALRPNDPFILQRISRQFSDSTVLTASPDEKRRLAEKALAYSQIAYEQAPKDPVNVLSLAICYGKLGLYGGAEEKVKNARMIKKYAEEALALDPNYDWAHHVLGRWHHEVAELGGTKRFLVKLFYGGLPTASFAESVKHLQRAVELAPDTVGHRIELGFAFRAAGRLDEARAELERGLELPAREIHDEPAKRRAREALAADAVVPPAI